MRQPDNNRNSQTCQPGTRQGDAQKELWRRQTQWGQTLLLQRRAELAAEKIRRGLVRPKPESACQVRLAKAWQVRLAKASEELSSEQTTLKVYGGLVMAARARKDGTDSALRVWHVGRQLNSQSGGSGVVSVFDVRVACERMGWVVSQRHWRRLLADGDGLLWYQVSSNGKQVLRLVGLANLTYRLGIERIDWRPVEVPADRVGKLKSWRAAGYAAWLAGKSKHAPTIARVTQRQVTEVPERTQRTYTTTEPSIRAEKTLVLKTGWLLRECWTTNTNLAGPTASDGLMVAWPGNSLIPTTYLLIYCPAACVAR